MAKPENLKMYKWNFQDKYTIFTIANNLEEAKATAIKKACCSLEKEVTYTVEKNDPQVYDDVYSYILETGATLIG
jgi:hypothetical protein